MDDYTTKSPSRKDCSPLDVALAVAAKGKPVFPCRDKDTPLTPHGVKDATKDPVQIHAWWKQYPDALVGMPTGSKSGIDALNLSGVGLAKFRDWETMSPVITFTPTRLPDLHNNIQILFASNGKGQALKKLPGLPPGNDIRGEGEYIVIAGKGYLFWKGGLDDLKNLPPLPDNFIEDEFLDAETIAYGIAAALGGGVRMNGKWYNCRCPAHHDNNPSFGITDLEKETAHGKVAFKCQAGCTWDEIVDALFELDLWPWKIARVYDYCDNAKDVRYQVIRTSTKKFMQRRENDDGMLLWGTRGITPLPYRLPELLASGDMPVFLPEGEKDVENLMALGFTASCNHMGAGKWSAEICPWFKGRDVVILPDNDKAGRDHANDVAKKLTGIAKRIRVLALPGLAEKGDVSDWLAAGGTPDELRRRADAAPDWEPPPDAKRRTATETTPTREPRFPVIRVVDGDIARIVDEAEQRLIEAGVPIFERGNQLRFPDKRAMRAADEKMTETVYLRLAEPDSVVYHLNKSAATFHHWNERKQGWVEIDPPRNVAATLVHRGQWKFPRVAGVITTPTLRPDGTIIGKEGYDEATQLLYWPDSYLKLPPIKAEPTKEDARQALELLKGLLVEFPFVADVDRSVALAAMMSPVLRAAFDVGPLFLFLAHVMGSGKSYLVNLISTIATGRPCPVITYTPNEEEMEKRLGALLLEGVPIVSLDNCSDDIRGNLLCQMTEQPLVRTRILGKSEAPECEWRGTACGTGNNVRLVGDMTRRGLLSHLDPKMERPETRKFEHDPIATVLKDRGAYVAAILTIARAFFVAGCPQQANPIASYGKWSRAVREPLMWLGEVDPVASMETAQDDDPQNEADRALVALWAKHLRTEQSYTAADLIKMANEMTHFVDANGRPQIDANGQLRSSERKYPDLYGLLAEHASVRGQIDARSVGGWLVRIEGKIYDYRRIERSTKDPKHGHRYTLKVMPRPDGTSRVAPEDDDEGM